MNRVKRIGRSWKARNPISQGRRNRYPYIHCLRLLAETRRWGGADAFLVEEAMDMAAPLVQFRDAARSGVPD
jgi:hypothetical protein